METTVLGLTFEVHEMHLQDEGKLTLRCVASVGPSSTHNSHHNQYQHYSNNNNPPPAASTASLGGYERGAGRTNPTEHFYNPIIETMSMVSEVRFEGRCIIYKVAYIVSTAHQKLFFSLSSPSFSSNERQNLTRN